MKQRWNKKRPPPELLATMLADIADLIEEGKYVEALQLLDPALNFFPESLDARAALAMVAFELRDAAAAARACEPLYAAVEDDPEIAIATAEARMMNIRPALALEAYRRFLALAEDDDIRAPKIRGLLPRLEEDTRRRAVDLGLGAAADAIELVAMHDRIGALMDRGDVDGAIQAAHALIARRPDYVPARNNLSLALMLEGRVGEAADAARGALEIDPANVHALSNLVHFLVMEGREAEARDVAARLAGAASPDPDAWIKKAEAYSYVGDDESVLGVYREAEAAGYLESDAASGLLPHFAAVAELRLGRERRARKLWKRALDLWPGFGPAEENLADLEKPVGERHAPWAFEVNMLMSRNLADDFAETTGRAAAAAKNWSIETVVKRVLGRHPEIELLVPVLFDRGDPSARGIAFQIALAARTPALVDALVRFALGQRGPDDMRMGAAEAAIQAGALPRGQTRMWMRGEWRDVLLYACELHDEQTSQHSPKVNEWLAEGKEALDDEDYESARELFERAAAAEPNMPTGRYDLAATLMAEGRGAEAREIYEALHREFPDYLFASAALAKAYTNERRFDEAEALLNPLLARSRMRFLEFTAMCDAFVTLEHARKRKDAAREWLAIWKRVTPEHPRIEYWTDLLSGALLRRWTRG